MIPEKGVEVTIRGLNHLPQWAVLWVVGDGPDRARLQELSKALGMNGRLDLSAPCRLGLNLLRKQLIAWSVFLYCMRRRGSPGVRASWSNRLSLFGRDHLPRNTRACFNAVLAHVNVSFAMDRG
jgi:hypothetical protein